MPDPYKVAVLVGSLRKGSLNRKIALALESLSPPLLELEIISIGDLPHYDEDVDAQSPHPNWVRFRDEVAAADAVLFVTPEYNRSIPGVLKNAIDVGSRPYGHSVWNGKPGAVVSASLGAVGGFGANHHLRQCLVFLNVPAMAQPEAYLGEIGGLFGEQGEINDHRTETFLRTFVEAFAQWVEKISPQVKPR